MLRYDQPVYRPPSEANSLIIQAVIGCPHNRCAFCDMYKMKKFRPREQEEILQDLRSAREIYGPHVSTIFLADGNAIVLPAARLVEICETAYQLFPRLVRVTTYGSAKFVVKKKPEELQLLRAAGLTRIHMGLESGDEVTLRRIEKGADPDTIIQAGRMVVAAGMELSLYYMVGVAGTERWQQHAVGSARVVNEVGPHFVRLRTFVPRRGTPLLDTWQAGQLTLPDPYQALTETRLLVEKVDARTQLLSDHISNFLDVSGMLPENKQAMVGRIDEALHWPREKFRPDTAELIEMGL
ncbi:MAG: radical SAM protein [Alphaproteobacteria bacterium]